MASTSPKATRTASQTPQRGRGRGRPRLYARGTSSNTRRKPSASASKTADGTPTSRRKTGYNNGYRPGGAGGGGRYVHPSTGQIIPAAVYKEIIKSAERGGAGRGAAVAGVALPMTPAPPLPAAPPSIGPDGVYKPREERSYTEFHPGFDIEQPLLALTAEEVDGENYKPPALNEGKSVKIVDIKEEDEMKMSSLSAKEGSHREDRTRPEGSSHPPEDFVMPDSRKPEPESAASPISPPSNSASASAVRLDIDPMLTSVDTPANDIPVFAPPTSASVNGMAIDPALAALTPPPIPSIETTVPIDPALAMEYAPAQTQTPAATPTEPANDETIVLASTPPPTTPAVSGISPTKRGVSDVPTLASLRAHRSNAGKPPPRPQPPPTTRKPRAPTVDRNTQEKLTLRAPSFRKIEPFKFAEVGGGVGSRARRSNSRSNVMEPISDKMIAVGYQQSAEFKCPDTLLRDQPDLGVDDELGSAQMDLVEYDMDEQDDKWLTNYNSHRMVGGDNPILPEIFEYVMTKTEKEWVSLERKMPKVQAKPHGVGLPNRRRSSGRTGEDEDDEGAEDSKCAICDDGECENANAIVFCDGCNLAVHQECYGVPYIPEGQWHCRKCQQIPRQVANCVFCPNTDGAFKQTTTNRWAHLLCAIWIPEVRLANPSFMEPVEGVELVPKSRWKLNCYICKQRMGACIQCSNRNCFQAFHVTCGRRARLHMKMKNTSGPGAQLESSGLKALCHKHVPADWRKENDVDAAAADAMEYYAINFADRDWGDSHAAAVERSGVISDEDAQQGVSSRTNHRLGDKRKQAPDQKTIWKLSSGAPVIPRILYRTVVDSLARFNITNVDTFAAEACKYWTLKREARRGASLVRRLQVQADSNSFTSLEVIRKNYAAMGHTQGGKKLERRKEFSAALEKDLVLLVDVVKTIKNTQDRKLREVETIKAYVDSMYFPELPLMRDVLDLALKLDTENMFQKGFGLIVDRMEHRLYPSVSAFVGDIRSVLRSFPSDPKLDFEIRIKSYAPPSIALPPPTASKEQIAATGAKILNSLKVAFDNALAGEYSMRQSMPERAAKKPRLLEHLGSILVDTSANVNGAVSPGLNSPSLQLVKESLPQKDKGKATPTPAGLEAPERQGGGTILGTVASVLAKEITVGFERPKDESHDTTGMDIDTEPVTVDHISHHIHAPLSAKSEAILANAEAEQHVTRSLSPQPAPEIENLNGIQPVITAPAEMSTFDDDFDMEDAPGDVDEDFIPPVEAPSFAPISVAPNPVHEDKHIDPHEEDEDEDAEGDIDDEVPPPYTRPPPPPPVITTLPDTTIFPDVDPAHSDLGNEDDLLLGGYRPEDLPSPLGTIMGESTSPMDTSADTANAMLDASHFQQHQPSNRDPMTDLPDLPPNNGLPDKQELLENMTNTSVLSDYPDDLDENDFGMHMRGDDEGGDDDDDADEADDEERGENEATPPGKKSRKSMTFKRESNGRFGRAASGRERRKRR